MSVTPGMLIAVFRFLSRVFPPTPLQEVTDLSIEELKIKYRTRDRWGNVVAPMAYVVLAVGYYFLLDHLASWLCRDVAQAAFLLPPERIILGMLAGFMSLTSIGWQWLLARRLFMETDDHRVYSAYRNHLSYQSTPVDLYRAAKWFFWLAFVPLTLFSLLFADNYTAFTDRGIIENPLMSLGKKTVHDYTDVHGVYAVRGIHGRFEDIEEPFVIIQFSDGKRWKSDRGAKGAKLDYQLEIARFVADRSQKQFVTVNFAEDIPAP